MPNFLCLTDNKTNLRHEGRGLIEVDEKLCEALGVTCDPVGFYLGWVDWMPLYLSDNWEQVRDIYANPKHEYDNSNGWVDKRLAVIDWLAANYNLNSYAMIGRR